MIEPSAPGQTATAPSETELLKRPAPTFWAIIAIKLLKGVVFLTVAVIFYTLSDNDLPAEFRDMLHWLRLNPERRFFHELAMKIGTITEANMVTVGVGSFVYSLFSLVEGIGMMYRASWAGWMAIGESAFFIPIEIYELLHHFTGTVLVILVVNIIIVEYLFRNRGRLFRHHHRR